MESLVDSIRIAVADSATAEQKSHGAQACRTILAALDAEAGKPIALAAAPVPSGLAGISPDQALDLLIAKLRSLVPAEQPAGDSTAPRNGDRPGLRIAFVPPPPRQLPRARRKP